MTRIATLALLLACAARSAVAEDPVLHWAAGTPTMCAAGHADFTAATDGTALTAGTQLRCGDGFQGQLDYADGTQLKLKEGTWLEILADGLRLYQGATWIKVKKSGRGFRCVTPSAIASVRGTQFAVEVVGTSRLVSVALLKAHGPGPALGHSPIGALVAVEAGLAAAATLVEMVPDGRMPSTVKVFEGRVLVAREDPGTGKITDSIMVAGGQKVLATGDRLSRSARVAAADYRQWSVAAPAGKTSVGGAQAAGAAGSTATGAGGPSSTPSDDSAGGRSTAVTLLDVSDAP